MNRERPVSLKTAGHTTVTAGLAESNGSLRLVDGLQSHVG